MRATFCPTYSFLEMAFYVWNTFSEISFRLKYSWCISNRGQTASHCVKALQARDWLPDLLFQILDHSPFKNAKSEIGFENKTYARSSTVHKAKINIYFLISKFSSW